MRVSAFICDECKVTKGVSNHWWLAWIDSSGGLHASFWDQAIAAESDKRHLCGQECVHKAVDRWMATGQINPDNPHPGWDARQPAARQNGGKHE
jgi:hypothetical protein